MRKSRVVFSFDDARLDTYRAINIAKKYGIKSTLNVTTAYVEDRILDKGRPTKLPAMSKMDVISFMNDEHVELACHSDNHNNEFQDIIAGKNKLREWIDLEGTIGFASPSSKVDFSLNPLSEFKENGFKYVRIGPTVENKSNYFRYIRKISRILKLKYPLYLTYKETLANTVIDNYLVHGIPVLNDNTVNQFKCIIKNAIKNQYDCVLIFHSVLGKNEDMFNDMWSWDIDKYITLCEWLKMLFDQNKIEFCVTSDIVKENN